MGLSVSQTQSGAYALVLAEDGGDRRIPIIIGPIEAQSIAIQLEGLQPSRPLTHDLFKNMSKAFGIELSEVFIYKLEEGIFYSEIIFEQNGSRVAVDSRTSDAVALALRFKSPVYTTEEILSRAGIVIEIAKEVDYDAEKDNDSLFEESSADEYGTYSDSELNEMLSSAITNELYEQASKIRDEIKKRKEKK